MSHSLDPGNRGSRQDATPRWPDRLARRARELAHAAWRHAVGEEEPAALGENARYRTGFLAFQRWSPLVVPLVLGGALLALTLWLTGSGFAQPYSPAWSIGPVALVVLALIGGALLGGLLAVAPTDALWLGALVAGSTIYLAAMLCAVFGLLAGILPVALVAAAGFFYARGHRHAVVEGTIALTERNGAYLRTLYPGSNLLWPGEQVLGTLETGQRIYICPTQRTQVRAPDGTQYRASASAIVGFAVIPQEAHATARSLATWEQDLHQFIAVALREALQQWSTHEITPGGQAPAGLVARWVLDEVRGWARACGIWVAWVRVCHMQLGPAWENLDVPAHAGRGRASTLDAAARQGVRSGTGYAARATPPPPSITFTTSAGPAAGPARPVPRLPSAREPAIVPAAHVWPDPPVADARADLWQQGEPQGNADLDHLTPDALADLYDAIREGHINTPETIREVAHAFAHLAQDLPADAELPFDAAAAADALLQFAAQLERHNASVARAARTSHGTAVYEPTQDLLLNAAAH